MFTPGGAYWTATRHPWSCVLFVLPLLAIYEVGLYFLGPTPVATLRNGADVWLRTGLAAVHISPTYGAPVVLLVILLAWTLLYREARPHDPLGVWIGMTVESIVFAALLYGISQGVWPLLNSLGGMLDGGSGKTPSLDVAPCLGTVSGPNAPAPALVNLVRYFGAGIYEETLFRLLFFSGLLAALNLAELPSRWSILIATLASAFLFAGAHNLGPHGEAFQGSIFLFRTLAGVYFAWIYCVRGFGVAVGAHAGYDVLVGLLVRQPIS
jgi:Type II CAAX prenyl endopeptidase Rce1-like